MDSPKSRKQVSQGPRTGPPIVRLDCVESVHGHPGYSDSIVHVLNQALLFTQWAFTHLPASKSVAGEVISLISEKIGDPKVNQSVVNCLNAMSEVLSPGFVICHLCKHTGNHRNPKVIKESVDWIWNTVEDYGMDGVNGKALVLYLKSSLHSSNAQVEYSASYEYHTELKCTQSCTSRNMLAL